MRKSMFAALLVLTILLCGCSDVSTAPTKNENSELVTETEAAAKKESTEIVFSSESEDVEKTDTKNKLETDAEVSDYEPVQNETVKHTEPVEQTIAETESQKAIVPEVTPESTPEQEAEETKPVEQPIITTSNATADDCKAVADKVVEYINSYRSTYATKLAGLTQYSEYRSEQLISNFAHDTADQRAAATALQYGTYIDPVLYGIDGDPYYKVEGMEAIAYGAYVGNINEIAEKFALQIYNSGSHWGYVGSGDYQYIGVGIAYRNGAWYCCIMVSRQNTDTN